MKNVLSPTAKKRLDGVTVTIFTLAILIIFLSPFAFMIFTSLKTQDQISIVGAPIYPAAPPKIEYNGQDLEVFIVPLPDGTTKELAMLKKGQKESIFIDPENTAAGEIIWTGSWRNLDRPWKFSPTYSNYQEAWEAINYPRLLWNTLQYAIWTEIGVLISCTLVAFGFARFPLRDSDIDDFPARLCDRHPNLYILHQDRLGGYLAATDRTLVLCECVRCIPAQTILHDLAA